MKNLKLSVLTCIFVSVLVCYFEPANAAEGNTFIICNSSTNCPVFPNPATSGQTIRAIALDPIAAAVIIPIGVGSVIDDGTVITSTVEGNLQFPIDVVDGGRVVTSTVEGNLQFPIDAVDGGTVVTSTVEGNLQFPIDVFQNTAYFSNNDIKARGGLYSAGLTLPSELCDGNYVIIVTTATGGSFSGTIFVNHGN